MKNLKKDFPIFSNHQKLVYLDSAATSQKPKVVIDAISDFYSNTNANVHRGAYELAENATIAYEQSRQVVADFLQAGDPKQIVFTKSATESINLIAQAWAKQNLQSGDVILISEMEHHANIVPWQQIAREKKLALRYWPIDSDGKLKNLSADLLKGVKLLALTHESNVLGTINPIAEITKKVQRRGIKVLIDAAQSAAHEPVSIKKIDPDFLVLSGHKMLGPTGIGVLYIKKERFKECGVYQTGGNMIEVVGWQEASFKPIPWRFEAGTPPIAQAIGLTAAIKYLQKLGMDEVKKYLQTLTKYAQEKLTAVEGLKIAGPKTSKGPIISFTLDNIHPHDLTTWLNQYQIATRAGHHCAEPLHEKLGLTATVRTSFYIYNTTKDIDKLAEALKEITKKWHSITK